MYLKEEFVFLKGCNFKRAFWASSEKNFNFFFVNEELFENFFPKDFFERLPKKNSLKGTSQE